MIGINKVKTLSKMVKGSDKFYANLLRTFRTKRVVEIIPFCEEDQEGFLIKFSNGKFLTAVDGSKLNSALQILTTPEAIKLVNRTRDYLKGEETDDTDEFCMSHSCPLDKEGNCPRCKEEADGQ